MNERSRFQVDMAHAVASMVREDHDGNLKALDLLDYMATLGVEFVVSREARGWSGVTRISLAYQEALMEGAG